MRGRRPSTPPWPKGATGRGRCPPAHHRATGSARRPSALVGETGPPPACATLARDPDVVGSIFILCASKSFLAASRQRIEHRYGEKGGGARGGDAGTVVGGVLPLGEKAAVFCRSSSCRCGRPSTSAFPTCRLGHRLLASASQKGGRMSFGYVVMPARLPCQVCQDHSCQGRAHQALQVSELQRL